MRVPGRLPAPRPTDRLLRLVVGTTVAAVLVLITPGGGAGATSPATVPQPAAELAAAQRRSVPVIPARLVGVPVDPIEGYQGQVRCRGGARKGTMALLALIVATYGSAEGAGLNRECVKGSTSEHYDGRAIDWMVNSRVATQAAKGDSFTRWLTRSRRGGLGAMARRLGIMYVIWRGQVWKQYQASAGWQTYERCDRPKFRKLKWDNTCHRNHVHLSLTWSGARMQTSWWTGQSAG